MKITKFYRITDVNGKKRFESIYRVDTEFYLKKLLRRKSEQALVTTKSIVEVLR